MVWHCKGDGGIKCCLLCRNIFARTSKVVADDNDGDGMFCCDILTLSGLDLATSDEIIEAVRRLHAFRSIDDRPQFLQRQIALGFTYMGYNLMTDPQLTDILEPADQLMHDWMHCCFVAGVWNVCVQLVLTAVKTARGGPKNIYELLREAIQMWRWPAKVKQTMLHKVFEPGREKKNRKQGGSSAQRARDCRCMQSSG